VIDAIRCSEIDQKETKIQQKQLQWVQVQKLLILMRNKKEEEEVCVC
jgi:hypothetical protein